MFYPKLTFLLYRNCSFGGIKFIRGVHHVGFGYTYLILEDCLEVKNVLCCFLDCAGRNSNQHSVEFELWMV